MAIASPNPSATSRAGYSTFAADQGSFHVFFVSESGLAQLESACDVYGPGITQVGWYWVAEFPGCLPDGEPAGPFNTSAEAYRDARSD